MRQVWSDPTGYPTNFALHGKVSGFPASAITAFMTGTTIPSNELSDEVLTSPAAAFSRFTFSRAYWQEELEVGQHWAEIIKAAAPSIYTARMTENINNVEHLRRRK